MGPSRLSSSSDSSSDESSSEESTDDELEIRRYAAADNVMDFDEDEDEGGRGTTSSEPLRTKHEVVDPSVTVPDIEEVGENEVLEQVGEIMSILENLVIVKGLATNSERASERALDSDSLLVFEDRKVLGYVCVILPALGLC